MFRAVERAAWNEAESDRVARGIVEDARKLLDFEALDDDFLAEPLAQQIDRILARFDLIGAEPAGEAAADDEDAFLDYDAVNRFKPADEAAWGPGIAGPANAPAHDTS